MSGLSCADCGREGFRSERGLAAHVAAKHPPQVEGEVAAATDRAVEAASHLGPMDGGVVEVLRTLARTIDGMPERDPDAPMDNVTVPTYLKYAQALGLTPASRKDLGQTEERSGSKLAHLRSVQTGRAS